MRRAWLVIALLFAVPLVFFPILGVASDGSLAKRPLDLPAGGKPGPEESEEDAPETIVFYGSELEGDCFVWCFPVYGFCGDTTVYAGIRQEIESAVNQLSDSSDFSLVAYNMETFVWSPIVVAANPANKASAIAWMALLVPIEAHYLIEAAVTTLGISQAADSEYKQVIICGARQPYCSDGTWGDPCVQQSLIAITGANYEQTPIHTIYFTTSFYSGEQAFYMQLASMNGGDYRLVPY